MYMYIRPNFWKVGLLENQNHWNKKSPDFFVRALLNRCNLFALGGFFGVAFNGWTGTDDVAVAIGIVDPGHGWPEFAFA